MLMSVFSATIRHTMFLVRHIDKRNPGPKEHDDFFGPDKNFGYPFNFPGFGNVSYTNITANYELTFTELTAPVKVRELLDTKKGLLCYKYE
jgi:hypothetical protein